MSRDTPAAVFFAEEKMPPKSPPTQVDASMRSDMDAFVLRETFEQGGVYGIGLQIDTNPPYPVIKPPTRLTDVSGLNLINDKVHVGDQLVKVNNWRVEGGEAVIKDSIMGSYGTAVNLMLMRPQKGVFNVDVLRHIPVRTWQTSHKWYELRHPDMPLLEADHKILDCFERARRSVFGPGGDIQSASGESSSIGLVVDAATRTVTSILLGSAAHLTNQIAVGDVVVGVNGTPFTSDRHFELGQGQCGQFVDLTFSRAGTSDNTTVRLVREHRETLEGYHLTLGQIEELLSRAEDRGDESMKQAMNHLWDSVLTSIRTSSDETAAERSSVRDRFTEVGSSLIEAMACMRPAQNSSDCMAELVRLRAEMSEMVSRHDYDLLLAQKKQLEEMVRSSTSSAESGMESLRRQLSAAQGEASILDKANAEMREVISSLRQRILELERQLQQELSNEEGLRSTLESETLEENELRRKLKRAIAEKEAAGEGRGAAEGDAKRARGDCEDAKLRMREERSKLEGEMERERMHYEGVVQLGKQSKAKVDADLKKVMGEVEELRKAMAGMVPKPALDAKAAEVASARNDLAKMEKSAKECKAKMELAEGENLRMQQRLTTARGEIESLRREMEAKISVLKGESGLLKSSLDELSASFVGENRMLIGVADRAKREAATFKDELDEALSKAESLNELRRSAQAEVSTLNTRLEVLKAEMEGLVKAREALRAAQAELGEARGRVDVLEAKLEGMVPASLLKIAQQKAEECEKECERAEKRAKEVNDKFGKLQGEVDASKSMVSGLQAEVMGLGNEIEVAKGEREQAVVEREREKTGRKVAEEGLELSRSNERKLNSYTNELKTQVMGLEGEVEMWKGREALAKVRVDEAEARVKATEKECQVKVNEAEDRIKELSAVLAAVRKTLAIGGLSEDTSLKVLCNALAGAGGGDIIDLLDAVSKVEGSSATELLHIVKEFAACKRQPLSSISLVSTALRSGTSERTWAEGARLITVLNDGPKALSEADLRTLRNAMGGSISADVVSQILSQLDSLEALLDLKKQITRQVSEITALKIKACTNPDDHYKIEEMNGEVVRLKAALDKALTPSPPKIVPSSRSAKGSLVVKMSANDASHDVYFTTDGTDPGPSNFADHSLGSASVKLSESCVVRACVIGIGGRKSQAQCEDYKITSMAGGLGILIGLTEAGGFPVVRDILPDGAAAKDGTVRVGDRILSVDGESTQGMGVDDVHHMTYGEVGSGAVLSLERDDGSVMSATICRSHIPRKLLNAPGDNNGSNSNTPRGGSSTANRRGSLLDSIFPSAMNSAPSPSSTPGASSGRPAAVASPIAAGQAQSRNESLTSSPSAPESPPKQVKQTPSSPAKRGSASSSARRRASVEPSILEQFPQSDAEVDALLDRISKPGIYVGTPRDGGKNVFIAM